MDNLIAGVIAAKDGTEKDKEKAMSTLLVGVTQIKTSVAKHLLNMKAETQALALSASTVRKPDTASDLPDFQSFSGKMEALLFKIWKKVKEDMKDPANRHNPKVLLDAQLFLAVKDSMQTTEAVMTGASEALKREDVGRENSGRGNGEEGNKLARG